MNVRRGDVVLVLYPFASGRGASRRPALIVQKNRDNRRLANTIWAVTGPPQPADLQEAEALCRALELGPLLDRMPAGMWQLVGETGWQLSHGERCPLYIARALLQGAPILILDESFAALDPETLHRVHQCVLDRVPTLMVIAHP